MESTPPSSEQDRLLPVRQGCLYFLPMSTVFQLLHMQGLPRRLYEQAQDPGWLTWKTFNKWSSALPADKDLRPTQKLKLEKMIQSNPAIAGLQQEVLEKDALWRPYAEWLGLVCGSLFNNPKCIDYWKDKLEAEWLLACKLLPASSGAPAKLALLAESALTLELGAPGSRQRLRALLAAEPDQQTLIGDPHFLHCRLADCFATLLRFAAWLAVDASLFNWELLQRSQKTHNLLLEQWLPRSTAQGWSNPVGDCLEHFADLGGCSSMAALGELWAQYEYQQGKVRDITSKQRSLRDWVAGTKGRPTLDSVHSLAQAVGTRAAVRQGIRDYQPAGEIDTLRHMLHFAETTRYLHQEMHRQGVPDDLIETTFSVYAEEYRHARRILGRPLPGP